MVAFHKVESIGEASTVAYFKALSRQSAGGTKENHENIQSAQSVSRQRFEPVPLKYRLHQKYYYLSQRAPIRVFHFPNHLADVDEIWHLKSTLKFGTRINFGVFQSLTAVFK
jgi:hypothetical protein